MKRSRTTNYSTSICLERSSWPSFLELSVVAVVGIVIILTSSWVGQNKSARPLMVARHVCDCPGKCVRTLGEHVDEKHVCNCTVCDCPVKCRLTLGDHVGENHVQVQPRKWIPFSGATMRPYSRWQGLHTHAYMLCTGRIQIVCTCNEPEWQ